MSDLNRPFWGTILFEQIGDGCYNGIWQNNDLTKPGRIHNEIIRKIDGDRNEIVGNYVSSWIEGTNDQINTRLEVRSINNIELAFYWHNAETNTQFRGIGMQIGLNKLIAIFWFGDNNLINLSLQQNIT